MAIVTGKGETIDYEQSQERDRYHKDGDRDRNDRQRYDNSDRYNTRYSK